MMENQENEEMLIDLLASASAKAFKNGASSSEIYQLLMQYKSQKIPQTQPYSKLKIKTFINSLITSVKFFFTFLFTLFITILSVSNIYSINPFLLLPPIALLTNSQCLFPSHPIFMELTRPLANCSMCSENQSHVEFETIPLIEDFGKLAYSARPIIVRGGALGAKMSYGLLKKIIESEEGGVESVTNDCQFLPFRTHFKSLAQVFTEVREKGWKRSDPWYIGWSNCHPGVKDKIRKVLPRPNFLPKDSVLSAIDWIFIGTPGHGAAMHLDYVRRPSWQAQLSGTKTWKLRPPPECEETCTNVISFTINAGDMLFLDTNSWYHETFIEGTELSISIGSEYD